MTDDSQEEEELEELLEQLKERQRERQRRGRRGRGANRKDREMVEDVAREKGMSEPDRREFGDYVENIKRTENRGGDVNFTYRELLDLADEFLGR